MSTSENSNNLAAGIVIKTEPGAGIKRERLTSFKLPRDLTLGSLTTKPTRGGSTVKKAFTPNLNVVRNKNTDVKTSRDTTANGRGRGRGDRGGKDRGRGNKRGSTLVQTSGFFSEGTAGLPINRRSSSSSSYSGSSARDTVSQMRKPTINRSDREMKIDLEDEKRHMDETLPDDDNDDFNDKSFITATKSIPIMLTDSAKILHKIKLEKELKIKVEKTENDRDEQEMLDASELDGDTIINEVGEVCRVKKEKIENQPDIVKTEKDLDTDILPDNGYPEKIEHFFNRRTPQIFLLQVPDTLPGRGPVVEPADSAEFERPETPNPRSSFCTVKQLEEGLIGKIVRYKSGRTKLVLGETRFNLSLGMDPGFLQELASINTNREERSGNIVNLGEIQAKLSASPDWEYIIKKNT